MVKIKARLLFVLLPLGHLLEHMAEDRSGGADAPLLSASAAQKPRAVSETVHSASPAACAISIDDLLRWEDLHESLAQTPELWHWPDKRPGMDTLDALSERSERRRLARQSRPCQEQ